MPQAKPRKRNNLGRTTKKKSSPGWFMRNRLVIAIVGVVMATAICVMAAFALQRHNGPATWITIPAGATPSSVSDSLRSSLGTVEGNRVFMLWRLAGSSPSRARGRYRIDPGQFSATTAMRLHGGTQTPVKVSWTDVRTLGQLAERVARNMDFTPSEFLSATDSLLSAKGYTPGQYPAAFIPDSYEFYYTAPASAVVKKLIDYRDRFWTPQRIARAKELGLTPTGVATIASIVEEESAKTDERPVIARLYLNRLNSGMPLQADPTVKFASGDFALRRITGKHLAIESPYNTYRHRGLPPGPIRIAAKSTLEAVLTAPDHDYLYMCAKEDFSGRHNFARDYPTHQANAARYQAELNRRGIR